MAMISSAALPICIQHTPILATFRQGRFALPNPGERNDRQHDLMKISVRLSCMTPERSDRTKITGLGCLRFTARPSSFPLFRFRRFDRRCDGAAVVRNTTPAVADLSSTLKGSSNPRTEDPVLFNVALRATLRAAKDLVSRR